MSTLQNKIDFLAVLSVSYANPNGDPLNGNRPRTTDTGLGEMSDVSLKRKIRNRLMDMGEDIFVQSDDKKTDEYKSLRERADANAELKKVRKNREAYAKIACESWIDVRSFGQVFAFSGKRGSGDGISVPVRGPVSLHPAFSIDPVNIQSIQITRGTNNESSGDDPDKRASDTMGMKHRIEFGCYILKGSINVQLAEKTGFSEEDAEKVKEAIRTLFVNDSSSARPDGSMSVVNLYWWKHSNKLGQYSSAKVHDLVKVKRKASVDIPTSMDDYSIEVKHLDGLDVEIIEGL